MSASYDAVVVGSGPNGLGSAITLAQHGLKVAVFEAQDVVGGGLSTRELTLPGFQHDLCSGVHPMAIASPFLRTLPLHAFGLQWIQPPVPLAHPLADQSAALHRSVEVTAQGCGRDAVRYRSLMTPLVQDLPNTLSDFMGPLLRLPRHPLALAKFGLPALLPAEVLGRQVFRDTRLRALFAGLVGHSVLPFHAVSSSAIALALGAAGHAYGWPFPQGGAVSLANAMAAYFRFLGGHVHTGIPIHSMGALPKSRVVLLDVGPHQIAHLLGDRLQGGERARLNRYRYGPGVFKVDYALSGPVPWRDPLIAQAGTVHLGGEYDAIARSELEISRGQHSEHPLVIASQPSLFDPSRAPTGHHTFWAYCHTPNGSVRDMTARIEAQIERYAPGFRDLVLARHKTNAADLERLNPNFVGGDVNGGSNNLLQVLGRPALSTRPYRTPLPGIYQCSAATPPGGGVHAMAGHHAARAALADHFGIQDQPASL